VRRRTLPLLEEIDRRIDGRAEGTREAHPWWPCAAGCDHCCRSLPTLPAITRPEWDRLAAAIGDLPPDERDDVARRIASPPPLPPITCPLLDVASGRCRVYAARPVACRTYGFYTERDAGLHCDEVTRAVAEHDPDAVVWGNGEAIADDLRPLGEVRTLDGWLAVRR
jgi:Fe-S-cluster containining protein